VGESIKKGWKTDPPGLNRVRNQWPIRTVGVKGIPDHRKNYTVDLKKGAGNPGTEGSMSVKDGVRSDRGG